MDDLRYQVYIANEKLVDNVDDDNEINITPVSFDVLET